MMEEIIKRATLNASTQAKNLSFISTNVVNYSTNTYRAKQFETYLDESGTVQATIRPNMSNGAIELSRNPLDVAIDGQGYFYVTKPDGSTAYTRDGRFIINAKGYLSTLNGALVGGGIKVPINYFKLDIDKDGTVKVRVREEDAPTTLGKITIVNFPNPGGLKELGGNMQGQTEASGAAQPISNPNYIKQYATEKSNVSIWDSIGDILRSNGSYIASLRIVKYADELYRQSVNLRQ